MKFGYENSKTVTFQRDANMTKTIKRRETIVSWRLFYEFRYKKRVD
jgi:hypothetical protein